MKLVAHISPSKRLACWYIAFQMLATTAIVVRECDAQQGPTLVAQLPEPLPPPTSATPDERVVPEGCKPVPVDTPLPELIVDIRPRNLDGEVVASDQLPLDCAAHLSANVRSSEFDLSCASCQMSLCELLQLAQYCHNPLYFEERLLERYGIRTCCCQPLASAACFYGNALCLPAKMWRQCPCSCVPAHPCD
jgi:hypothetical protein